MLLSLLNTLDVNKLFQILNSKYKNVKSVYLMTPCFMKYNTREAVIEGILLKDCSEKFYKMKRFPLSNLVVVAGK